jgi:hypothetical protein
MRAWSSRAFGRAIIKYRVGCPFYGIFAPGIQIWHPFCHPRAWSRFRAQLALLDAQSLNVLKMFLKYFKNVPLLLYPSITMVYLF